MDPGERLERFQRVLERLREVSEEGTPILVEGVRDAAALRALGVPGELIVYNDGNSMPEFAHRLRARKRIALLFDWDRKGGHLTRLLREHLAGAVQVDADLRKELASVSLVRCVEDLPAALETLRRRAGEARARSEGPLADE